MEKQWDKDRVRYFKNAAYHIMACDVDKMRYDNIQKLYEAAGITKAQLVRQLKKKWYTEGKLEDCLLYDLCAVITEKISENDYLRNLFIDLYKKQYPEMIKNTDLVNTLAQVEPKRLSNDELKKHFNELLKIANAEDQFAKKESSWLFSQIVNLMFVADDETWNNSRIKDNVKKVTLLFEDYSGKRFSEFVLDFEKLEFDDSDENVFESGIYKSFYQRVKKLYSMVIDNNYNMGADYTNFVAIANILKNNNWSQDWFFNECRSLKKEDVIETYCQTKMYYAFDELTYADKPCTVKRVDRCLSKIDLSNEKFLTDISAICLLMGLFNMAFAFRRQYYKHFSWDGFIENHASDIHEKIYKQYDEQLAKKDQVINSLTSDNEQLKERIRKNDDLIHAEKTKREKQMEKELEDKENEIERLKKKLEMAEQYAEILRSADETEESDAFDLDELKKYRYMFVIEHEEVIAQLRNLFPDSIFVTTATTNVKFIKVDAVIVLTRYISHTLYYKVRSSFDKKIYCNGTSVNSVLNDMYKGMKSSQME